MDMNEQSWRLFLFLQERFPSKKIDKDLFYLIIKEGFTEEVVEDGQGQEDSLHLSEMKVQDIIECFSQLSEEGFDEFIAVISTKMANREGEKDS